MHNSRQREVVSPEVCWAPCLGAGPQGQGLGHISQWQRLGGDRSPRGRSLWAVAKGPSASGSQAGQMSQGEAPEQWPVAARSGTQQRFSGTRLCQPLSLTPSGQSRECRLRFKTSPRQRVPKYFLIPSHTLLPEAKDPRLSSLPVTTFQRGEGVWQAL